MDRKDSRGQVISTRVGSAHTPTGPPEEMVRRPGPKIHMGQVYQQQHDLQGYLHDRHSGFSISVLRGANSIRTNISYPQR